MTTTDAVCKKCGPTRAVLRTNDEWNFARYIYRCSICEEVLDVFKKEEDASQMIGGLKCSTIPPFHLIPRIAYVRLAERVALGEATKGKDAWNALSSNQHVLKNKIALARRLGHAINHALSLLDKIAKGSDLSEGDDDAAALMWAGMYAICSTDALAASSASVSDAPAVAVPAPPAPCQDIHAFT